VSGDLAWTLVSAVVQPLNAKPTRRRPAAVVPPIRFFWFIDQFM
jgi:hypothetical protein